MFNDIKQPTWVQLGKSLVLNFSILAEFKMNHSKIDMLSQQKLSLQMISGNS